MRFVCVVEIHITIKNIKNIECCKIFFYGYIMSPAIVKFT